MNWTVATVVLAVAGWSAFLVLYLRSGLRPRRVVAPRVVPERTSDEASAVPFTEALAAIPIGVVIAATTGDILYRNKGAAEPTGSMHSDLLVEEAVDRHLRAALAGHVGQQTLDLYGPPRRVLSVMVLPLAGGGAVALVEDTTEQALVDAVRTDFVANISHELKTPIGALAVLAEALSQVDDPEVVRRLSDKIADEAMRVGRTIDDLLELSRIEFGGQAVMEEVDVDTVVAEAIGRSQTFADSRSITVDYQSTASPDVHSPLVERGAPPVLGDRRQLVSALGNLIENAVKYSEPGGRVLVSTQGDGRWVEISVRDFGMGIPAKDLDRIFERFYRVDRARSRETGGTGLGLTIVHHVATSHGGRVMVASEEGEGSTFTLVLPEARPDREAMTSPGDRDRESS